ncbi:hypothetical protein KUV28_21520, partial [Ferrimonas balearica]|nr:hypothetical protein [Ferrimonas balearica]
MIGIGTGAIALGRGAPRNATSPLASLLASLYGSGEQGAFYLPDDTTCFQDAAATIPAGEGDPVGFMLDNSQGA